MKLEHKLYGMLAPLMVVGESDEGVLLWECVCLCGGHKIVNQNNLTRGNTKSCGCIHGRKRTFSESTLHDKPEYRAYHGAKSRCTNVKDKHYSYYGGRNIQFNFTSFEQFYAYLGDRPPLHTLDRLNNDGHYEIGNVRWATQLQQVRNSRKVGTPRLT